MLVAAETEAAISIMRSRRGPHPWIGDIFAGSKGERLIASCAEGNRPLLAWTEETKTTSHPCGLIRAHRLDPVADIARDAVAICVPTDREEITGADTHPKRAGGVAVCTASIMLKGVW